MGGGGYCTLQDQLTWQKHAKTSFRIRTEEIQLQIGRFFSIFMLVCLGGVVDSFVA